VAASYALLILYVTGVLPLIPMVAGWAILIDAPHVLAHSRALTCASEWKTRNVCCSALFILRRGPTLVCSAWLHFFFVAALWAITIWSAALRLHGALQKRTRPGASRQRAGSSALMFALTIRCGVHRERPERDGRVPPMLPQRRQQRRDVAVGGHDWIGSQWLGRQISEPLATDARRAKICCLQRDPDALDRFADADAQQPIATSRF